MLLTVFLGSFAFFFLFGMPLAGAMITSSFIYIGLKGMDLAFMGMQMFSGLDNFVLIAIPMFVLTSEVMTRTSVSDRLFKFCNDIVGYIPGGLGHVNIASSIIFAGMSGSAVADASGIGYLAYKAMLDEGFDEDFSAAVSIASSTIGPIIPPSIPMVVYAMVANVSVGKMFFGGIVPGLLMGLILMVYVYFVSLKRHYPHKAGVSARVFFRNALFSFFRSIFPLLTPVILLGGIYLGVVTTTEASAIAVFYSLILGFVLYRTMKLQDFWKSLESVFITSGSILLVIPAAKVFGFVMTAERMQDAIYSGITALAGNNPMMIMLCINILFLILGCISDPTVNIMLFVPMLQPLIRASGFDPVFMGVVIVVNAMIGNVTPPVGLTLMTTVSLTKLKYENVVKELWPLIGVLLVLLMLIIVFPQLVLFVPNLLFKR
jgi:tripartite ATP-independent transporter DctM subunit